MKYLLAVGVIALGVLFWQLSSSDEITNYPASGTTIVAFGDSLVAGVGATGGNDFVSKLEEQTGRTIINLGESGDTTADGLERLDQVLEQDPQVVLLLLGGNDAIKNIPLEETKQNLSLIIEEIHSSGAVVVLLGVRSGLLSDSYKNMYEDLAKEHGTAFVSNVLSGVFGRANLMSDPIHPNNAGYQVIADRVAPVLGAVIN